MRLRVKNANGAVSYKPLFVLFAMMWGLLAPAPPVHAAGVAAPPAAVTMNSPGWLEIIAMKLENEAMSDASMLPDTPGALDREWRSFDRNGSAIGALANVGWVVLATCLCLLAERSVSRGLSRRARRTMRLHAVGPALTCLLTALLCDMAGLAVFVAVFVYSRHWLMEMGVTINLVLLSANILIRWRAAMLVLRTLLRPHEPVARLIELADDEARRLMWFFSASILAIIVLIGFGRYGLADEDSGAPHIIGLIVAAIVCGIYTLIVYRARAVAEALIRGRSTGLFGALRAALARAWLAIGLLAIAGLFVFFVFGLSLGLLSYYHGVVSTLGVLLVLLVLEQLTEHAAGEAAPIAGGRVNHMDRLVAHSLRRIFRAIVLLVAAMILVWIWVDAINLPEGESSHAMQSSTVAVSTLFIAYLAWELARMAIDRNLPEGATGPRLPGSNDDEETTPGSRLQTILPIVRVAFGAVIAVVAALTVLSRLGIDTAPLIAGAGVFGLAISFGSQSLVRDIISGLFYIWDDGFRVGEYIDTGRLRGTVEVLGIRSMKLRHHNGPLHTIPYGQLGAVTNLSRDFATIKFNLRLEPGTDIELVRRTAKRIGIEMQDSPEIASEVILPLKMQGIAEIADNAVILRFKFTARPIKPTWIQREYLKRMYAVFAEKSIVFASGVLTLQTTPNRYGSVEAVQPDPANVIFAEAMGAVPAPASRVA